jgi:glutamate--cysteine ligase
MSKANLSGAAGLDQARAHIAERVFGSRLGGPEVGRIGLEPEYLTLRVDGEGLPVGRLPLEGEGGVLDALGAHAALTGGLTLDSPGPPPLYSLANGGRLTFEPGAQVEHSTAIHDTAAAAMDDVDEVAGWLLAALAPVGGTLGSVGLDLWTDRSLVEQQLRAGRYHAMAAYLAGRSEHGAVMMRHTCSFQVNLDLGEREVAEERWRLANLLTPVSVGSFACSPEEGWTSRRARAWQKLDPTRTGFPACLLAGLRTEPGLCYAELALDADVLLFRRADGGATPGTPGFRLRDWIEAGHPEFGRPTLDDIDYHLTTLFPEVRLRGFFEIRSADATPLSLRAAQVVFWTGLLYDPAARAAALERLEPEVMELQQLWVAAARDGLADEDLHRSAVDVWRIALEGAGRLPAGYHREQDLACAERFFERYVEAGRSPGDELRERLRRDPAGALRWSMELENPAPLG